MPYIYKDGVIYGGGGSGGGNSNVKELTYEEYLALGETVNDDDITYFITDKEPEGGSGGNSNVKEVTLAEYEALGEATENDDITYFITDLVQEGGNGGSGGSVDVDYSQIEFDTTEILVTNVTDDKTCCGMRYNADTDMFQVYYNGEWVDSLSAAVQWFRVIEGNVMGMTFTGERTLGSNYVQISGSTPYLITTDTVDLTKYKQAIVSYTAPDSGKTSNWAAFGFVPENITTTNVDTMSSSMTAKLLNTQGSSASYSDKVIDLSNITGKYKVAFCAYERTMTITKVFLK